MGEGTKYACIRERCADAVALHSICCTDPAGASNLRSKALSRRKARFHFAAESARRADQAASRREQSVETGEAKDLFSVLGRPLHAPALIVVDYGSEADRPPADT